MMSSASDPSPGWHGRRRLPRLTLARRLAAGVPPTLAAEGSGMTPQAVEAMLTERGFQRTVAVYRDLLAAPHEVRLQRLYELALQVLEQALAEGCRLTLFFMLRERSRGRDPVAALVAGIERKLKDAPPPAPASAPPPAPEAPPPSPEPSVEAASSQPEAAARRRPDPMDAQAWRTATRLRGQMIDEAGLAAAAEPAATQAAAQAAAPEEPRDDLDLIDPVADPLGAAVHKLHREADRRHAEARAAQAATDSPPPQGPNSQKSSLLAAILARKRDGPGGG